MELVSTFEDMIKRIFSKYDDIPITIGILIADYRQTEAREYILNYLNIFDKKSGKYIDFYLPGYNQIKKYDNNKSKHIYMEMKNYNEANKIIAVNRTRKEYFFDDIVFENFLYEFETKTSVKYVYNPMLILVEINMEKCCGEIEYQNILVIDLDDNSPKGIRRSGLLFDEIFEIAKREVNLSRFERELRMHYLKGNKVKTLVRALDGNFIESLSDTLQGIMQYKIIKK